MSAAPFAPTLKSSLRKQLVNRRARLQNTISDLRRPDHNEPEDLLRLLSEVDSALTRVDHDDYGMCKVCLTPVAEEDIAANPMTSYCLCDLSSERQRALERDLDLAWQVQAALLPPLDLNIAGWQTHYRYVPHGVVSGDYCDLIPNADATELYFMLGDVSGKGVAASLLMAHLNAALRTLAQAGLPPQEVMAKANRLLSASSLTTHYATLVCGRAKSSGEIELVNAGHCEQLIVRASGHIEVLRDGGLPLGLIGDSATQYPVARLVLNTGDALVLYTDGLTDATNSNGEDYDSQRLIDAIKRARNCSPRDLIAHCLADLSLFLGAAERGDDLTMMVLARNG